MQFFETRVISKNSYFLPNSNVKDALLHNSLENIFALVFNFFNMKIFLKLLQRCYKRAFSKYAVALKENACILMSFLTSAWIFSNKFSAY